MPVLYRKYRSQTFKDLVGQKPVIHTLQNQILKGKVSHAYLFTGGRGVGKTSVARILAKAVNCVNQSPALSQSELGHLAQRGEKNNVQSSPGALGDACGECVVCKAIENNNFIDLIEIDAASNTGVDNVRDIIDHVRFAPSLGKYKVFIIDEVHMLSKGAFNALLKTLEEPPKHAIFILATTEIQKVPATIISRTQKFDFKALSVSEITEHLKFISKAENLNYSEEILNLVAQSAQGSARDSLSILDKISTLGPEAGLSDVRAVLGITDEALLRELVGLIAEGKAELIPAFFDRLLEQGADFVIFNKDCLEFLRVLLVEKITGKENPLTLRLSLNDLIFTIRLFLKSFKDSQGAPSPEIPLLLAAVEASLKKQTGSAYAVNKQEQVSAKPKEEPKHPAVNGPEVATKTNVSSLEEVPVSYDQITLEEVNSFWQAVVAKIKEQNGPLGSLLRAGQIQAVEHGRILINVKYQFDKKTLEKNSFFIGTIIKEVSGKNLGLVGQIAEKSLQESPVAAISDALKIFGGEVIE